MRVVCRGSGPWSVVAIVQLGSCAETASPVDACDARDVRDAGDEAADAPDAPEDDGEGGGDIEDDVPGDGAEDAADVEARSCETDEDCDDEVECTVDRCDPDSRTCRNEPDDGMCEDGNECTFGHMYEPSSAACCGGSSTATTRSPARRTSAAR